MEVGKICPEHGINPDTGRCKKGERKGRGQCVMNENGRCVKIQQVKRDSKSAKKTHKQHKELYETAPGRNNMGHGAQKKKNRTRIKKKDGNTCV